MAYTPTNNKDAANRLFDLGYRAIPIDGKRPIGKGWQSAENPREFFDVHARPDSSVGVVCGQPAGFSFDLGPMTMIGLDFDFTDEAASRAAYAAIGGNPAVRIGRAPKFLMVAQTRAQAAYSRDFTWQRKNEQIVLQVLGASAEKGPKQFVQWGVHPDTGQPYYECAGSLFDIPIKELPVIDVMDLVGRLNVALAPLGWVWQSKRDSGAGGGAGGGWAEYSGEVTQAMIDDGVALFNRKVAELSQMAPGAGRGKLCYDLGRDIGWLINRGAVDRQACEDAIEAVLPSDSDSLKCSGRDFPNGVEDSVGYRQQCIAEGFNPEGAYRSANWDWAAQARERVQAEAQAASAGGFRAENRELYAAALITGVCDIMHGAIRERDAEKQTRTAKLGWDFMASLLAAGMATPEQLAKEWQDRAQRLNNAHGMRYAPGIKAVNDGFAQLQPSEEAWALCAADLMAQGKAAGDAIRQSQTLHRTPENGDPMGPVEAAVLEGLGNIGWTLDDDGRADSRSWSDFAFFMAVQLNVWPFFDEFTQRTVFKRLTKRAEGLDPVSDGDLEAWGGGIDAAVAGLFSLATDRRRPWAGVEYTPMMRDIDAWLRATAVKHRFNSMTDRMAAWPAWDEQERLGDWLARYTGHGPDDAGYGYVCGLGAYWLAGLAMRAQHPGSKFDLALVLAGLGGSAKTSMLREIADGLAPGSFVESGHMKFDTSSGINRVAIATVGKLIVEMAEMRDQRGHDSEGLKALITAQADEGRGINGRDSFKKLRQFVFAMTINGVIKEQRAGALAARLARLKSREARDKLVRSAMADADFTFLRDRTGNRRFGVVKVLVYEVDRLALRQELPQLIAEAKERACELGMVDRGGFYEMAMPEALRAIAGEREEDFMVEGDMKERLRDVLAEFADEDHLIATYSDFWQAMGLKSKGERDALKDAFRDLDFIRSKGRGTDGAIWFVKGDKAKAKHIKVDLKNGPIPRYYLDRGFGDTNPHGGAGAGFKPMQ